MGDFNLDLLKYETHNGTDEFINTLGTSFFQPSLGVTIDQKLTWTNHINSVLKSITKSTGMIAKLRHYTNKNTLKLIYYALVYPYLTYGNLVWGNTYPTRLQNLLKIQKKIVWLMCFKSYTDHSEPLFFNLKILNIYKINDHESSQSIYVSLHEL